MSQSNLVGRRAVCTRRISHWNKEKKTYITTKTETFNGEIVWAGDDRIMMLYSDGSLRMHGCSEITVEAPQMEGPYR